MIDIHCHILPGVDDGPATLAEAVRMARIAVKDGIKTVVATPHCFDGAYNCEKLDIAAACRALEKEFHLRRIPLTVVPGAEVRLTPEFLGLFRNNKVPFLGGAKACLLIELPEMFIIDGVIRVVRLLQESNVRCIVAHPERNSQILARPEIVSKLIAAGAEMQLTAASVLGDFGRAQRDLARKILGVEGICWLASDGHCSKRRKPRLKKAVRIAGKFRKNGDVQEIVQCNIGESPSTQVSSSEVG